MATTADLKNGMYIMFNGKPCVVVYFQHVKPGKGPAFVKTKLRNLENGRILENTFTAGVKLDTITVERRPYQYLYDCTMTARPSTSCTKRPTSRSPFPTTSWRTPTS